ncbi:MAG: hypothetical protein ACI8RD_005968, partial [Bacillariaceae sp.]
TRMGLKLPQTKINISSASLQHFFFCTISKIT